MHVSRKAGVTLAVFISLAATGTANAYETIGGSTVQRPDTDFSGGVYVFDGGFTQPGTVYSFDIYSGSSATQLLTPLLLSGTSGNYNITGIGDTVTSDHNGVEAFTFDLASGSAAVGPGYTFGFKDGGVGATGNLGTVTFDTYQGANFFYPSELQNVPISLGQSVSVADGTLQNVTGQNGDRTYSIQFSAVPPAPEVPETGTLTLIVLGLGCLTLAARRRRRA